MLARAVEKFIIEIQMNLLKITRKAARRSFGIVLFTPHAWICILIRFIKAIARIPRPKRLRLRFLTPFQAFVMVGAVMTTDVSCTAVFKNQNPAA